MKAIRLHVRGGLESLRYEDAPAPRPGPGKVLVRVRAAAVTPTEFLWVPTWTTRDGGPRPLPVIPGHEFSGEVAALGEGVTAVGLGTPVYGMNDWFADVAQAEYCLARPAEVASKPASIDHAHAAVTPISALTAGQGLLGRAEARRPAGYHRRVRRGVAGRAHPGGVLHRGAEAGRAGGGRAADRPRPDPPGRRRRVPAGRRAAGVPAQARPREGRATSRRRRVEGVAWVNRLFAALHPPEGKQKGNACPAFKPGAAGTPRGSKTSRFPARHARRAPGIRFCIGM